MYQFEEEIDWQSLFVFDKRWIKNMNWAALPKSSKSTFPVILSHCNKKGLSFPSERRIAILSGRTDKQVREGVNGLIGFPGFKVDYYTTRRGKRAKRFHVKLPAVVKGETFPFHRSVIYGGNWSQLTPTARALFPVMRYFGYFDLDEYSEGLEEPAEVNKFDEIYKDRNFDFCEADTDVMAKLAGIARRSIRSALINLEDKYLVEEISYGKWKVFLTPFRYKNRSFLNKQIMDRYKHEKTDGKNYR